MCNIVNGGRLPDYGEICALSGALSHEYPALKLGTIGKSLAGRDIISLTFGDTETPVLFAAAFHAQEWLTSLVLLRFCERLLKAVAENAELCEINVRKAFSGRGVIFLPCVNPDGVEIVLNGCESAGGLAEFVGGICAGDLTSWNANAHGVDLNHNFDAGWSEVRKAEIEAGILGPAPRRYGGVKAESEPETKALTQLCRSVPIRHAFALHSQGEEIYWQYGAHTPPKSRFMAQVLSVSSGYTLAQPEQIASHGGFKDWFIEEFHRPAFTLEIGRGKNPLPLTDLDSVYRTAEEMLLIGAIL